MVDDYPVKIVRVIDGDSVKVRLPNREERSVRMYGIDAPEKAQKRGGSSTEQLEKILRSGRDWRLHVLDEDHYQRLVGLIYCEDDSSIYRNHDGAGILSANHEMVRSGWAHWYAEYGDEIGEFENLERYAKQEQLGVWQDDEIIYPWDFRKRRREAGKQPKQIGWLDAIGMLMSAFGGGRRRRRSGFMSAMLQASGGGRKRRRKGALERALTGSPRRRRRRKRW